MPPEKLKTEVIFGTKMTYEETRKTAVDRAKMKLQKALPGHTDAYYADALNRILLTATKSGYTIESTTDAFIKGAKARGE